MQTCESVFENDLLRHERLLWCGQPLKRIVLRPSDWYAVPFSIMWGGFALFWESVVLGHGSLNLKHSPDFFVLWGIPFVLVGQYMIWGRFLYTAWLKGRTYYAVTDRRVLVSCNGFSNKFLAATLSSLPSITMAARDDCAGTITFAENIASSLFSRGKTGSRSKNQIGIDLATLNFFDIADVKAVYRLLQDARQSADSHAFQTNSKD